MAVIIAEGNQPHQRLRPEAPGSPGGKAELDPPLADGPEVAAGPVALRSSNSSSSSSHKKLRKKLPSRGGVRAALIARGNLDAVQQLRGELDAMVELKSAEPPPPPELPYFETDGDHVNDSPVSGFGFAVYRQASPAEKMFSRIIGCLLPCVGAFIVGNRVKALTRSSGLGAFVAAGLGCAGIVAWPLMVQWVAQKLSRPRLTVSAVGYLPALLAKNEELPFSPSVGFSLRSSIAYAANIVAARYRGWAVETGRVYDAGPLQAASTGNDERAVVYRENKRVRERIVLREKILHDYASASIRSLVDCPQVSDHLASNLSSIDTEKSLVVATDLVARVTLLNLPSRITPLVVEGSAILASLRAENMKVRRNMLPGVGGNFCRGAAAYYWWDLAIAMGMAAALPLALPMVRRLSHSATSRALQLGGLCSAALVRCGVG